MTVIMRNKDEQEETGSLSRGEAASYTDEVTDKEEEQGDKTQEESRETNVRNILLYTINQGKPKFHIVKYPTSKEPTVF